MLSAFISLLRPQQYIKNLFVFIPSFFGLKLFDIGITQDLLASFIAFSLIASAVYIFNDSLDIERDRSHPIKKMRPLASGAISIKKANTGVNGKLQIQKNGVRGI